MREQAVVPRTTPRILAVPKILTLQIILRDLFSERSNRQLGCNTRNQRSDGMNAAQWRLRVARPMTFRIESAARGRFTVFVLSGRIEKPAIAELMRLFECQTDHRNIVLDLKDVSVIDRDIMCFFVRCETDGVKLENCASYIREWMDRERD